MILHVFSQQWPRSIVAMMEGTQSVGESAIEDLSSYRNNNIQSVRKIERESMLHETSAAVVRLSVYFLEIKSSIATLVCSRPGPAGTLVPLSIRSASF